MTEIGYAHEEHPWGPLAICYTSREGWVFSPQIKHWVPMHPARRLPPAAVLTKVEFERMFPNLPALPEGAFEAPLTGPSYGHWEHVPIRFTDREAWLCSLGSKQWRPLDTAEVEKSSPLTRLQFERMFPGLPPLPDEAFRCHNEIGSSAPRAL